MVLIKLNAKFMELNIFEYYDNRNLSGSKAEVVKEVDGDAKMSVVRAGRLQPDYLSLRRKVGNVLIIQKRQRGGDG